MADQTISFVLSADTARAQAAVKSFGRSLDDAGKKASNIGGKLTRGVTLPIVAAGAAMVASADVIDRAMIQIRSGTGATGAELDRMGDALRNIQAPQAFNKVAKVLVNLNITAGVTGDTLQALAQTTLDAARLMGINSAALARNLGQSLQSFQRPAEDAGKVLDFLFQTAQNTGVGLDALTANVRTFGPVLANAGFTIEEVAGLFGQLETAGVDVTRVMPGINNALRKFASQGLNMRDAMEQSIGAIKGATDETKALDVATKIFGAEGAARLTSAVRSGTLNMENLTAAMEKSQGAIERANKNSLTFAETMSVLKKKVAVALETLGVALLDAFTKLKPHLENAITLVGNLASTFSELPAPVLLVTAGLAAVLAAAGPLIAAFGFLAQGAAALAPAFAVAIKLAGSLATTLAATTAAAAGMAAGLAAAGAGLIAITHFWAKANQAQDAARASLDTTINSTQRLANHLATKYNVVIKQGTMTTNQWQAAVHKAASALTDVEGDTKKLASTQKTGTGITKTFNIAMDKLTEATKKQETAVLKVSEEWRDHFSQLRRDREMEKTEREIKAQKRALDDLTDTLLGVSLEFLDLSRDQDLANTSVGKLVKAYQDAGIKMPYELEKIAKSAQENYQLIAKHSGEGSAAATEALVKSLRAQQKLLIAQGAPDGIVGLNKKNLDAALADWEAFGGGATTQARNLNTEVSTIFTNMAQGIADAIVEWKSLKDVFLSTAKEIAKAILGTIIQNALKPLLSLIGEIAGKFGSLVAGLFGAGASAGDVAAGAAGGGGGGFGGGGGPLSLVTLFEQIFGIFQRQRQIKGLGMIEENTRFTQIALIGPAGVIDRLNTWLPFLEHQQLPLWESRWFLEQMSTNHFPKVITLLSDLREAMMRPVAGQLQQTGPTGVLDRLNTSLLSDLRETMMRPVAGQLQQTGPTGVLDRLNTWLPFLEHQQLPIWESRSFLEQMSTNHFPKVITLLSDLREAMMRPVAGQLQQTGPTGVLDRLNTWLPFLEHQQLPIWESRSFLEQMSTNHFPKVITLLSDLREAMMRPVAGQLQQTGPTGVLDRLNTWLPFLEHQQLPIWESRSFLEQMSTNHFPKVITLLSDLREAMMRPVAGQLQQTGPTGVLDRLNTWLPFLEHQQLPIWESRSFLEQMSTNHFPKVITLLSDLREAMMRPVAGQLQQTGPTGVLDRLNTWLPFLEHQQLPIWESRSFLEQMSTNHFPKVITLLSDLREAMMRPVAGQLQQTGPTGVLDRLNTWLPFLEHQQLPIWESRSFLEQMSTNHFPKVITLLSDLREAMMRPVAGQLQQTGPTGVLDRLNTWLPFLEHQQLPIWESRSFLEQMSTNHFPKVITLLSDLREAMMRPVAGQLQQTGPTGVLDRLNTWLPFLEHQQLPIWESRSFLEQMSTNHFPKVITLLSDLREAMMRPVAGQLQQTGPTGVLDRLNTWLPFLEHQQLPIWESRSFLEQMSTNHFPKVITLLSDLREAMMRPVELNATFSTTVHVGSGDASEVQSAVAAANRETLDEFGDRITQVLRLNSGGARTAISEL